METSVFEFFSACIIMGLGIGTDVAIATLLRADHLTSRKATVLWIGGVSLTHTLFPMAGYLLAYFSVTSAPTLTPVIGLVAFACIAYFIVQEVFNDDDEDHSQQLMISLGLILAVSWDALWSGPAKSAQVINWPELWVWVSFIVVGLIVTLFALASLFLGHKIQLEKLQIKRLNLDLGQWLQLSIIAYFGLLALLRYTLGTQLSEVVILLFSALLMACLLTITSKPKACASGEKLSDNDLALKLTRTA